MENQINEDADEASGDRDEADHAVYRIFHGTRKSDGGLMGTLNNSKDKADFKQYFLFLNRWR